MSAEDIASTEESTMSFQRFASILLGLLILGVLGLVITEFAVPDQHSGSNGIDKDAAKELLRQAYSCVDAPLIEPFIQKFVVVSMRVEETKNISEQNVERGDTNGYPALAVDPDRGLKPTYTGQVEAYSIFAIRMFTISVFESGCSVT